MHYIKVITILNKRYARVAKQEEATAAIKRLCFAQFQLTSKDDRTALTAFLSDLDRLSSFAVPSEQKPRN